MILVTVVLDTQSCFIRLIMKLWSWTVQILQNNHLLLILRLSKGKYHFKETCKTKLKVLSQYNQKNSIKDFRKKFSQIAMRENKNFQVSRWQENILWTHIPIISWLYFDFITYWCGVGFLWNSSTLNFIKWEILWWARGQ